MMASDLLGGIIVETNVSSYTGSLFYSDEIVYSDDYDNDNWQPHWSRRQSVLNELSRIWVVGVAAGVIRMALATIHTVGHLFMSLLTFNKGHLYHAAKGGCEFLRGLIESLPYVGRKFARSYVEEGHWWMIKIYNPNKPDHLDLRECCWEGLKSHRPTAYVVA